MFGRELTRDVAIKQNIQLLDKAVATSDSRFTYRVLKLSNLRKQLTTEILIQVVQEVYPPDHASVGVLLPLLTKVLCFNKCIVIDG